MTKIIFLHLLIGAVFILGTGCPAVPKAKTGMEAEKKSTVTGQDNCNTVAVVKDMKGLDGCNLMLILENGKKFLPAVIEDELFELKAGQKIRFGYTIMEDMMSICMAEDAIVSVNCIKLFDAENTPKAKCIKAISPYDIKWLKDLEKEYRPYQINRYKYEGEYAYLLKTKTHQYLYDCQGKLVCTIEGKKLNDCVKLVKNLAEEVVIWVVNH